MNFSDEIIDALSIDCVIFGVSNGILSVLLVKHGQGVTKGQWALPGGWIKYNESIDDSAYRILTAQTSVTKIYLVFDIREIALFTLKNNQRAKVVKLAGRPKYFFEKKERNGAIFIL